jgi:hypothetical protein
MSEEICKQQYELAKLIDRYSENDGVHPTAIPSLYLIRESVVSEPIARVRKVDFPNGRSAFFFNFVKRCT